MNNRQNRMALGIILGFFVILALFPVYIWIIRDRGPTPPSLAGQVVPAQPFNIDFKKRYDFHLSSQSGESRVYSNCRIVGFTAGGGGSSSLGSYGYEYFDHWLVIELPDKRRAFLPPHQILTFEEAK